MEYLEVFVALTCVTLVTCVIFFRRWKLQQWKEIDSLTQQLMELRNSMKKAFEQQNEDVQSLVGSVDAQAKQIGALGDQVTANRNRHMQDVQSLVGSVDAQAKQIGALGEQVTANRNRHMQDVQALVGSVDAQAKQIGALGDQVTTEIANREKQIRDSAKKDLEERVFEWQPEGERGQWFTPAGMKIPVTVGRQYRVSVTTSFASDAGAQFEGINRPYLTGITCIGDPPAKSANTMSHGEYIFLFPEIQFRPGQNGWTNVRVVCNQTVPVTTSSCTGIATQPFLELFTVHSSSYWKHTSPIIMRVREERE